MLNEITTINIDNMIYEIRGKQVMLDSDLAKLYQCKNGTKTINQAVSRHKDRFPNDIYFQVSKEECNLLWSQIGTANEMSRTLPYVFTEEGVAMLATILRTKIVSKITLKILKTYLLKNRYVYFWHLGQ